MRNRFQQGRVVLGSALLAVISSNFLSTPVNAGGEKKSRSRESKEKGKGKMNKELKTFSYKQTGGFAGLSKIYNIEFSTLDATDRDKLEGAIKSSGLLKLKEVTKKTPRAADMFQYDFTVVDDSTHHASFDDGALPDDFRALLEFSRERAISDK